MCAQINILLNNNLKFLEPKVLLYKFWFQKEIFSTTPATTYCLFWININPTYMSYSIYAPLHYY